MLDQKEQAGIPTTTHGSTAATGQGDPLTASGGGGSGSSDPHHRLASLTPTQQENLKLKTHHTFETLVTAVRVFKVRFCSISLLERAGVFKLMSP